MLECTTTDQFIVLLGEDEFVLRKNFVPQTASATSALVPTDSFPVEN